MPKTRTIPEINQEYFQTAAMLGDLEWKMSKFPDQIEALKRKLRTIDNEMDELTKLQAKEEQKKKAEKSNGATPPKEIPENQIQTEPEVVQ
jgi:hypothetical protein